MQHIGYAGLGVRAVVRKIKRDSYYLKWRYSMGDLIGEYKNHTITRRYRTTLWLVHDLVSNIVPKKMGVYPSYGD